MDEQMQAKNHVVHVVGLAALGKQFFPDIWWPALAVQMHYSVFDCIHWAWLRVDSYTWHTKLQYSASATGVEGFHGSVFDAMSDPIGGVVTELLASLPQGKSARRDKEKGAEAEDGEEKCSVCVMAASV